MPTKQQTLIDTLSEEDKKKILRKIVIPYLEGIIHLLKLIKVHRLLTVEYYSHLKRSD